MIQRAMETIEVPNDATRNAPRYAGHSMSKADFLNWNPDDGFLYEWTNGVLEPTHSMKQAELYLIRNIEDCFYLTKAFKNRSRLFQEIDCWVIDQQMRRPDLSFYTAEQIRESASGKEVIPAFVIEIISEHDDIRKVEKKLIEYFQAGVQVVWQIIPDIKTVSVFTSSKIVTICTDDDVVSAAPVVPDMVLKVNELFKV